MRQMLLELLGEHVFAVRQDDYVLLTSGDVDIAVVVDVADISGLEPAVVLEVFHVVSERALGGFLIFVITEHNVVALYNDFAEVLDRVFIDSDPLSVYRLADRTEFSGSVRVAGDKRRAFGDSIALEDHDAEAVEILEYLRAYRSSAADYRLHLTAHCGEYLTEKLLS